MKLISFLKSISFTPKYANGNFAFLFLLSIFYEAVTEVYRLGFLTSSRMLNS